MTDRALPVDAVTVLAAGGDPRERVRAGLLEPGFYICPGQPRPGQGEGRHDVPRWCWGCGTFFVDHAHFMSGRRYRHEQCENDPAAAPEWWRSGKSEP